MRERFEIELVISRDHGHGHSVAVTFDSQGFEDLLGRKTDLSGNALRREIIRVHFVLTQFVTDAKRIQNAAGVRLAHEDIQSQDSRLALQTQPRACHLMT